MIWSIILVFQTELRHMENENVLANSRESVKYRRNCNTLVVLGTGVILYGFWSIIKLAMCLIFGVELFDMNDLEALGPIGISFVMIVVVIIMAVDVFIRLHVGLRAGYEGKGKKVRKSYLIWCVWLILESAIAIALVVPDIINMEGDFIDTYLSVFMELCSLSFSIEVFIAGISVRKYRKKTGEAKLSAG